MAARRRCRSLHTAVHAPVLLSHNGAEILEHIDVVQICGVGLLAVLEEHLDVIDGVDVVRAGAKRLGHLHNRIVREPAALHEERVLALQSRRGVGFQVHCGIDHELTALEVVRHLACRLSQHVAKGGEDVEGLAAVAIFRKPVQPTPADLLSLERLRAVLHERVWAHIIVAAYRSFLKRRNRPRMAFGSGPRLCEAARE